MMSFLGTEGSNADVDMVVLMAHIQAACKHIAAILSSPRELQYNYEPYFEGGKRDDSRSLKSISNYIFQLALRNSGKVAAISSEEDEAPIWFGDGPYIVVFDSLDGFEDFDELTPTSTMFSIYHRIHEADHLLLEQKATINVMQRGDRLVAAGYTIYSSSTMMCFSLRTGLHGFTLDHDVGEFVLTHPDIQIPERGNVYSVDDGRYFDWPPGLRHYVDNIRQGQGQSSQRYSARHVSSLVADLHRTILFGGIVMNPRTQLHLIHEANAVSFLVENGGGQAIDGRRRILEIQPTHLHQRMPLFLGSSADVSELEAYGDIQEVFDPNSESDDDGYLD
nr:hypothetical protein PHYPA_028912 [Physcomitrium patens]